MVCFPYQQVTLEHLLALTKFPNLKELYIQLDMQQLDSSANLQDNVPPTVSHGWFPPSLTHLQLTNESSHEHVLNRTIQMMGRLSALKSLEWSTHQSHADFTPLLQLCHLEDLTCFSAIFDSEALIISQLPALTTLRMNALDITAEIFDQLSQGSDGHHGCIALKRLHIEYTIVGLDYLPYLAKFVNLTYCQPLEFDNDVIPLLPQVWPKLEHLYGDGTAIIPGSILIQCVAELKMLNQITLHDARFEAGELLEFLKSTPLLTSLSLKHCNFPSDILHPFAQVVTLPDFTFKLESLEIHACGLHVWQLHDLATVSTLRHLVACIPREEIACAELCFSQQPSKLPQLQTCEFHDADGTHDDD